LFITCIKDLSFKLVVNVFENFGVISLFVRKIFEHVAQTIIYNTPSQWVLSRLRFGFLFWFWGIWELIVRFLLQLFRFAVTHWEVHLIYMYIFIW